MIVIQIALINYSIIEQYTYKTLKSEYKENDELKIVSGGDIGNTDNARRIWKQIDIVAPDVVFIGGDLAYDNNMVDCYWTWDLLLD